MIKRIAILFLLVLFSVTGVYALSDSHASPDSLHIQTLIEEGIQKLKTQQDSNQYYIEHQQYNKLNFIVKIGTGSNDNLIGYTVPGTESFISDPQKEQQLNQRLQALYSTNQKQCYLLLISYFDVTIKGTPPDSLTIHDVFTTGKFYNENSDIQDWKWYQKSITDQIINSSTINKTVPFYFLSMGKYIGSFHKNQFLSYYYWNLKKNVPANATLPTYFNETYDYLLNYLKNGSFQDKNSDEKAEKFVAAYENSVKNAPLKAQILSTYSASDLKNILNGFTQAAEYSYLTLNERLHILSVFVNSYMLGNWGLYTGTEIYAVKTIKYTPPTDVNALLTGLEGESVLNTDPNYSGDKTNKDALIRRLISGIDDGVGSNYGDLMIAINSIIEKAPEYDSWLAEMMSDDEYDKRLMNWGEGTDNYVKINTVSMSDKALISITLDELETLPCDTLNKGSSDERIVCLPGMWVSATPYTLRPFKLVMFTNYSNLGAIDGATQTEKGTAKIVPAIYLQYSKDKETNYNIQKGISYTIDGLSLVSGVGAIVSGGFKALSWGRKAWLIYNTGVAATNLYINVTDMGNDPDFQEAYQLYTAVTVASGVGELTYNGVKNFSSCIKSTKSIINSTTQATKQQYLNLITKVDNLYTKLKNGTLSLSGKGLASLRKMKAYSEKLKQNWVKLFKEPLPNNISLPSNLNWIDDLVNVLPSNAKTKLTAWINDGLDANKLESSFNSASDKVSLFNSLDNAKSIQHQRVLIKDLDNIPGVSKTSFVNNSLPKQEIQASTFNVTDPQYNLPSYRAATFTESAQLIDLPPNTKIYRVTDPGGEAGAFWTLTPPNGLDDVIGGTAVMPEWNGFTKVVEYKVPASGLKVWKGKAAAQPISENPLLISNNYSLSGGDYQIFLNDIVRDQQFKAAIIDVTSTYKTW